MGDIEVGVQGLGLAQGDAGRRGFYIGTPVQSRENGHWLIPISVPLQRSSHDVTVLLKGGHLDEAEAAEVPDAVVRVDGAVHEVRGPRVATRASHGTGCTLSSALATLAGAGLSWDDALERAKPWLADAMRAGEALAVGDASRPTWHGPVDHGHAQRG